MKNRRIILALSLVLFLLLTACGTGTTPADAPPASAPPAPSAAPAASEAPVDEPPPAPVEPTDAEYVRGKGRIVIGYTVYAPMNYTDETTGEFTGFDTELAMAVCDKLGIEPQFIEINWDTKEVELAAKSMDCIWNGLTITEDRKANMEITQPYIKNAQVIVVRSDSEYTDPAWLIDKTVVAEAGSAGETTILGDDTTPPDPNLSQANYIAQTVQTACLMEVAAGTADAAVLDLTLAKAMTGEGTDYANLVIKDRLAVEDYGVAFRKGSDLCAEVNAIFDELKADGTMQALADKYGLDVA